MKRTILAIIVALIAAILIAVFQLMDLATLMAALEADPIGNMMVLGAFVFAILLYPYTLAMAGIYFGLAGLGVAGFISGLVSKSRTKMLFVSIIVLVIFFLGYFMLAVGGGLTDFSAMLTEIQGMVIDLGLAFGLLFIPGLIGATITSE
jgi:hypothetical protein